MRLRFPSLLGQLVLETLPQFHSPCGYFAVSLFWHHSSSCVGIDGLVTRKRDALSSSPGGICSTLCENAPEYAAFSSIHTGLVYITNNVISNILNEILYCATRSRQCISVLKENQIKRAQSLQF
eukprot:gb/GECG01015755.1/.p1 GENE.gb/GECG01015755.1/~~gb/GECG01015755.1/.p1  ORF type:complete len:124 (+),score=5.72 gb/GECG01015755.1/:1-372(+)